MSNTKPSLISSEASTAIKGLLMLLIVFGHTGWITTDFATGDRTFFWHWLYSFHVYIFLILPFIYGYSKKNHVSDKLIDGNKRIDIQYVKNDLRHNLIKIGVPYCWFFLFSAIVFVTVGGGQFDLKGMLYAFFFGNEPLMDKYIGFNFMWFLPAMLSLLTLKSVWCNSQKSVKIGIILVSITLWSLATCNILSRSSAGLYVPFALSQAFYFILYGLVSRWLVEKKYSSKLVLPIVLILIVAFTVLLYFQHTLRWHTFINVRTLICLVMPVLVFFFLYSICNVLSKSNILKFVGTYSLQIYLVHVFVINALVMLFTHFTKPSISSGVIIYVLALGISIGLSIVMMKIPFIKKIVFPNYKVLKNESKS